MLLFGARRRGRERRGERASERDHMARVTGRLDRGARRRGGGGRGKATARARAPPPPPRARSAVTHDERYSGGVAKGGAPDGSRRLDQDLRAQPVELRGAEPAVVRHEPPRATRDAAEPAAAGRLHIGVVCLETRAPDASLRTSRRRCRSGRRAGSRGRAARRPRRGARRRPRGRAARSGTCVSRRVYILTVRLPTRSGTCVATARRVRKKGRRNHDQE